MTAQLRTILSVMWIASFTLRHVHRRLGSWKESCESSKDASHPSDNYSAARPIFVHTLSNSATHAMNKLNMDVYVALPSWQSFLVRPSSSLLPIKVYKIFSVAVDPTRCFGSIPWRTWCSGSSVSLAKDVGVWGKSFCPASHSKGRL